MKTYVVKYVRHHRTEIPDVVELREHEDHVTPDVAVACAIASYLGIRNDEVPRISAAMAEALAMPDSVVPGPVRFKLIPPDGLTEDDANDADNDDDAISITIGHNGSQFYFDTEHSKDTTVWVYIREWVPSPAVFAELMALSHEELVERHMRVLATL